MKHEKQLREAGWRKAYSQFADELMKAAGGVTKVAEQVLTNSTDYFLDFVQMNKEQLPYYTGNLHDSIVAAVYSNGRVVKARYMPREARRPQTAAGRRRIVGEIEAYKAIKAYRPDRKTVTAVLFVAVPYAEGANRRGAVRRVFRGREYSTYNHHPGYIEWLNSNFESEMRTGLEVLKYIKMHPGAKPGVATRRRFVR